MPTLARPSTVASDLRVVLGQLIRRLRAEHRFPISQGAVLGRLDREGPQSTSDLAAAERVRPQSMAQMLGDLEAEGLITRTADRNDGRRTLIDLSPAGHRGSPPIGSTARAGWPGRSPTSSPTPSRRCWPARSCSSSA